MWSSRAAKIENSMQKFSTRTQNFFFTKRKHYAWIVYIEWDWPKCFCKSLVSHQKSPKMAYFRIFSKFLICCVAFSISSEIRRLNQFKYTTHFLAWWSGPFNKYLGLKIVIFTKKNYITSYENPKNFHILYISEQK